MVGNLNVALDVFLAGGYIRENRGQQIVGAHALDLRWHFLAALKTQQSQRSGRIPTPAGLKDGRGERCLFQDRRHAFRMQELKNIRQRKAVLLGERDIQSVVGGRRLQFEIEAATETLAQCQSPGLIDSSAKGRVNDQLHPAAFVKKS